MASRPTPTSQLGPAGHHPCRRAPPPAAQVALHPPQRPSIPGQTMRPHREWWLWPGNFATCQAGGAGLGAMSRDWAPTPSRGRPCRRARRWLRPAPPAEMACRRPGYRFADGLAVQVHGELGVDEQPVVQVEFPGDAVAAVGGEARAPAGRAPRPRDERVAHPGPDGGRPGSAGPPRTCRHSRAERYPSAQPRRGRRLGGRLVRQWRGRGEPGHGGTPAGVAYPPGGSGPGHRAAVRARGGLEQFNAAARAREPGGDADVADRDGAQISQVNRVMIISARGWQRCMARPSSARLAARRAGCRCPRDRLCGELPATRHHPAERRNCRPRNECYWLVTFGRRCGESVRLLTCPPGHAEKR